MGWIRLEKMISGCGFGAIHQLRWSERRRLAMNDFRKFGAAQAAGTYLQTVADLGGNFFSLGMAVKTPDKVLAELRRLESGPPERTFMDPYATALPLTVYRTEMRVEAPHSILGYGDGVCGADDLNIYRLPAAIELGKSKRGVRERPSARKGIASRINGCAPPRPGSRPRGRARKLRS